MRKREREFILFRLFRKKKKEDKKHVEKTAPFEPKVKRPNDASTTEESQKESKPKAKREQPYHVSKHSDGGWQVKRGGADRAMKRFDTQKEAIEYAKAIEEERGVGYVIHKADGTTRKKTY